MSENITLNVGSTANVGSWDSNNSWQVFMIPAFGNYSGVSTYSFFRFDGVSVPSGATINSAYLGLTPGGYSDNAVITTSITLCAADDPVAPTNYTEIAALIAAGMTAVYTWNIGVAAVDWIYESGYKQSVNIGPLIQAIIDRPGWVDGNAIIVLVGGGQYEIKCYAKNYVADSGMSPLLQIDYDADFVRSIADTATMSDAIADNFVSTDDSVTMSDELSVTFAKTIVLPGDAYSIKSEIKNELDLFSWDYYDSLAATKFPFEYPPIVPTLSIENRNVFQRAAVIFKDIEIISGAEITDAKLSIYTSTEWEEGSAISLNALSYVRSFADFSSYNRSVVKYSSTNGTLGDGVDVVTDAAYPVGGSSTYVFHFPGSTNVYVGGNSFIYCGLGVIQMDDIALNSLEFTIDFFVKFTQVRGRIFAFGDLVEFGFKPNDNELTLLVRNGISAEEADFELTTSNTNFGAGSWYHIAIVRISNTFNIYSNGTLCASDTYTGLLPIGNLPAFESLLTTEASLIFSGPFPDTTSLEYNEYTYSYVFNGYIGQFRISDVARYLSNFSPPSSISHTYRSDDDTTLLLNPYGNTPNASSLQTFSDVDGNSVTTVEEVPDNYGRCFIDATAIFQTLGLDSLGAGEVSRSAMVLLTNTGTNTFSITGGWAVASPYPYNPASAPWLILTYTSSPNPEVIVSDSIDADLISSDSLETQTVNLSNEIDTSECSLSTSVPESIIVAEEILVIWNVKVGILLTEPIFISNTISVEVIYYDENEENISMSDTVDVDWVSNSIFVNVTATAGLYK